MKDAQRKVNEFHDTLGAHVASRPGLLSCDAKKAKPVALRLRAMASHCSEIGQNHGLVFNRLAMALEEMAEWVEAHAAGDLVAAADAWGDRQYVLLGDAVAAGFPAEDIFDEIHRSNMTKVDQPASKTGKAQKDGSFRQPELAKILGQ